MVINMLTSSDHMIYIMVIFMGHLHHYIVPISSFLMKKPGVITQNHQQASSEWQTLLISCNNYISLHGLEIRKEEQCPLLQGSEIKLVNKYSRTDSNSKGLSKCVWATEVP